MIIYFIIAATPLEGYIKANRSKLDAQYDSEQSSQEWTGLGPASYTRRAVPLLALTDQEETEKQERFRTGDYDDEKCEMCGYETCISVTCPSSPGGKALGTHPTGESLKLRVGSVSQI